MILSTEKQLVTETPPFLSFSGSASVEMSEEEHCSLESPGLSFAVDWLEISALKKFKDCELPNIHLKCLHSQLVPSQGAFRDITHCLHNLPRSSEGRVINHYFYFFKRFYPFV